MIGIRLVGAEHLYATLTTTLARLDDLQTPLTRSGVIVRDTAVRRIKQQGDPAWPPTWRGGHIGIDTGRMWQSIGISATTRNNIVVGTNVKYAKYFQEGTGVFAGHQPWTVTAKNVRALHWVAGGQHYFARSVTIKGQPPRPFLYIDEKLRARVLSIFTRWIALAPGSQAA